MSSAKTNTSLCVSILLLCILTIATWPLFQYYIDPDATAYLTIAKRYALGDTKRAINAYWSPLSIWGTTAFILMGMKPFAAAIIFNSIGAIGVLSITNSFFRYYNITTKLKWLSELSITVFLWYAIYYQSFADLWEVFLLLCSLRILLIKDFVNKPALWIAYGFVGAMAYYAKAYAFPFFIINTLICTYLLLKNRSGKVSYTKWMKILSASTGVFLIATLPWIYILYLKYNTWMTSSAGKLNMSWYMLGHPEWKEGIKLLVPPTYPDSPYYWEDPWLANGDTPMFWHSWRYFVRQILRSGYNVFLFFKSTLAISVFLPFLLFLCAKTVLKRKITGTFPMDANILVVSMLIFPLPFFLINFEPRYIWYILPLSMILGSLYIQKVFINKPKLSKALVWLFPLSYAIFPLYDATNMVNVGKAEHELAKDLKSNNIHGSFASNISYGRQMQNIGRLAYFSGNPHYYRLPSDTINIALLIEEMNRYGVRYYYHFADGNLTEREIQRFPLVYSNKEKGLMIYLINP